jgi:hypothetical protein
MRVICDRRDQELLFMSHGMVSGFKKLWLSQHIKRCPSCKARAKEFGIISSHLRVALDAPRRTYVAGPRLVRPALAVVLLIVMLAGMSFAAYSFMSNQPDPPLHQQRPPNLQQCGKQMIEPI